MRENDQADGASSAGSGNPTRETFVFGAGGKLKRAQDCTDARSAHEQSKNSGPAVKNVLCVDRQEDRVLQAEQAQNTKKQQRGTDGDIGHSKLEALNKTAQR